MKTNVKVIGDTPEEKLNSILKQSEYNNKAVFHINRNSDVIEFLKQETGLDKRIMVLLYHYKEGIKEIPLCACGKEKMYYCYSYRPTCGDKKCQNISREISKKSTCLKKYGVEFVTQLETMKEKSKQSCMDRFGVDNSTKSPEIIQKRKENNIKKYGVGSPIALKEVRGKTLSDAERGIRDIQKGLPKGYNVLESDGNTTYKIKCPKKHIFDISKHTLRNKKKFNIEICNVCNDYIGSNGEQDVFEYVSSIYDKNIVRSNRKIAKPLEIDMVLEDIKLCIEFNGDYWHSIKFHDDRNYHLNKLNKCLVKGYRLIQIKEIDWNTNKEVVKRKLLNLINDKIDMNDFLIINNQLFIDLSWYDNRLVENKIPISTKLPEMINVGKEKQWSCGYQIYSL